jgi:hypothetical protein
MRSVPGPFEILTSFLCFITTALTANAQDLDPRAYIKAPVRGTILIAGFAHSEGGVLTDPTLPLEDLKATVNVASLGIAHTFSLLGRSAQALVVLPYSWLDASALVSGQPETASRTGFSDMRVRLSVLLLGGKAVTFSDYAKENARTFIGTSLTVVTPTGQYFADKLVNLGTRRWSFKPEVALVQKIGKRWMLDFYTGVWLFTTNETFYPGSAVRTQDPLVSFQSHVSYNINPRTWVAFDATFYTGGQSTVNETHKDDRQSNARLGATLALPVGKRSALKIAYSRGAIIRIGADFSTVSVGWSSTWFAKPGSDK